MHPLSAFQFLCVTYFYGTAEAFGQLQKYLKDQTTSLNVYNILKIESMTLCASKCDADMQCARFAFSQSRLACYKGNGMNNNIQQVESDMVVYRKQVNILTFYLTFFNKVFNTYLYFYNINHFITT